MSGITGRRSTGRLKGLGGLILEGLDAMAEAGVAAADNQKAARINEIDREIEALRYEQNLLVSQMHDSGDLMVDADFDPNHPPLSYINRKPAAETSGISRLTTCNGATYSSDRDVHPACPYKGERHGSHEFTARD